MLVSQSVVSSHIGGALRSSFSLLWPPQGATRARASQAATATSGRMRRHLQSGVSLRLAIRSGVPWQQKQPAQHANLCRRTVPAELPCFHFLSTPRRPAPDPATRAAGVSLLKFDNCFSDSEGEVMERFVAMRDALAAANASIVYMLCEWVSQGRLWPQPRS